MILMLNCSYKMKEGNTQHFLNILEKRLQEQSQQTCEILKIKDVLNMDLENFIGKLQKADAFVIGAPLYVDGLPAQAVKLLEMLLENCKGQFPELPVYVVSNLGFYESKQIQHLLDIVRNWCGKMGCIYGGGLAIGAGPMVVALKNLPLDKGLQNDIGKGFAKLAHAIATGESMENYYSKTLIPRVAYLKAAHMTFRQTLKENGITNESDF